VAGTHGERAASGLEGRRSWSMVGGRLSP